MFVLIAQGIEGVFPSQGRWMGYHMGVVPLYSMLIDSKRILVAHPHQVLFKEKLFLDGYRMVMGNERKWNLRLFRGRGGKVQYLL